MRHKVEAVMQKLGPVIVPVYWFCFLASPFVCVLWMICLPSAGKAIGVLGAVGVIVALRGEKLPAGHKFLWAVVTLLLLVIEVRAIDKDRIEQSQTHLAELKKQDEDHATTIRAILAGNQSQLTQNQIHFDATLGEMKGLAATGQKAIGLSSEAISQITGGESWLEIGPLRLGGEPLSSLAVTVYGKHPFYGESVEVYDSNGLRHRRPTFPFPAPASLIAAAQLGTYYTGHSQRFAMSVPVTTERAQMFEFRIIGRTGVVQEWVKLYRADGNWFTSGEVRRGAKLLRKWADPSFPKDWKLESPSLPLDPKLDPNPEK